MIRPSIRVVKPPTLEERLHAWYEEHGERSLPDPNPTPPADPFRAKSRVRRQLVKLSGSQQ